MELYEINPYIRVARMLISSIPCQPVIGTVHKILYCHSGEGKLNIGDTTYSLKEGSLIFIRAGIPYFNPDLSKKPTFLFCTFDFMFSSSFIRSPFAFVDAQTFERNMLIEKNLPEDLGFIPNVLYIPFAPVKEIFEESDALKRTVSARLKNFLPHFQPNDLLKFLNNQLVMLQIYYSH